MAKSFKINTNWIALVLLSIAYIFSAVRVYIIHQRVDTGEPEKIVEAGGKKFIRVTHWQLEPGFREGLQAAMDIYNQLPHVQDANVEVIQLAVTERVYNQFMNVHLISGTAPDIAAKGMTSLITGTSVAKFYMPLGELINEPNPYNAPEYLPDRIDPELADYLGSAPWRETFVDGMEGGWDDTMQEYYAVPIASWGPQRFYYNTRLLKKVKAFALEAYRRETRPTWMQQVWLRKEDGQPLGYLKPDPEVAEWLANDTLPQSLGHLFLYCRAVQAYAEANNLPDLVPIAGSSYSANNPAERYPVPFQAELLQESGIDLDGSFGVDQLESIAGFQTGKWSFESPPIKAYWELTKEFTKFFPAGFLGLDREQANRRFVLGNAAIITSGGWDAGSIFRGARQHSDPEDRFAVRVGAPPMPAPGERWYTYYAGRSSEANSNVGVPLAVNKATPHPDWALDFLKFVTSFTINEAFTNEAGWLPGIVGTEPVEEMRAFKPISEGWPSGMALNFSQGRLKTIYGGQRLRFWSNDATYEEFSETVAETIADPRLGGDRFWARIYEDLRNQDRARERALTVEEIRQFEMDDPGAAKRYRMTLNESAKFNAGIKPLVLWENLFPEEPYPDFN
ncbi:MAG: hypothetical protein ACFE0O_15435 [Opitutales bacterium]